MSKMINRKRVMWAPKSFIEGHHEVYTLTTRPTACSIKDSWVRVEVFYEEPEQCIQIGLSKFRELFNSGKTLTEIEMEIFK